MADFVEIDDCVISDGESGGLNGYIVYVFENGDRYEGEAQNSKPHGRGVFYLADGTVVEGDWKDVNYCDGDAIATYPNGDRYEGGWADGKRNGRGKYFVANGDAFIGKFENGELVAGDFYNAKFNARVASKGCKCDGPIIIYKGKFKNFKFHGYGSLHCAFEYTYDGEFKDGVFDGNGEYKWQGGDVFSGEWKDGKPYGKEILRFFDGTTKEIETNGDLSTIEIERNKFSNR